MKRELANSIGSPKHATYVGLAELIEAVGRLSSDDVLNSLGTKEIAALGNAYTACQNETVSDKSVEELRHYYTQCTTTTKQA